MDAKKILFVDDEDALRNAFARSLKGAAFGVDTADGADSAVALARASAYAAIAVDYRLSDCDGLSLIDKLHGLQQDATFLLVSGNMELDVALQAVNQHRVSFVLRKPWEPSELLALLTRSVEAYGERRRQRDVQQAYDAERVRVAEAAQGDDKGITTEALMRTLTTRGHETPAHCRRVAAFAVALAQEVGLTGDALEAVRQGALLHDIGKIGVPDALFSKSGALTPEEWRIMRRHPEIGARMLDGFPHMQEARRIIEQHHERWDGSGYPRGLAGEAICIGARVFALVDALDAMSSPRSYRDPRPISDAVAEICKQANTYYDPAVVAAFGRIAPERWSALRAEHPEEAAAPLV